MVTLTEDRVEKIFVVLVIASVFFSRVYMPIGLIAGKVFLLMGIILGYRYRKSISVSAKIKGYIKAYGIFVILLIPSIPFSEFPWYSIKEFFKLWVWQYVIFLVIVAFIRRRDYLEEMLATFLLFSGVDCLITLVQVLQHANIENRGIGIGGWLLTISGVMCMLLPIALVILMDPRFKNYLKKSAAFATVGILIGLLCNKSRGAWLTVIIAAPISVFQYLKNNRKYLFFFCLIVLVIAGFMVTNPKYVQRVQSITNTTTDHSNADRIWCWKSAKRMIEDRPITGVGPGQFYTVYIRDYRMVQETQGLPHAHNNFIHIAVEGGLIGLCGFLYFVAYYLYTSYKNYRKSNSPYDLLMFVVFLAHICLMGLIDYTLWYWTGTQPIFWFLLAILLKLKETDPQRGSN